MSKSLITIRRKKKALCPKCKSPDWSYEGRTQFGNNIEGKHNFKCNSCDNHWQYGMTDSVYTETIAIKK